MLKDGLFHGQFFASLVATLGIIGAFVVLVGISWAALQVWRFSQPLRAWLRHCAARFFRAIGAILKIALVSLLKVAAGLLVVLLVRPWQASISIRAQLDRRLRQVPWGTGLAVLGVCSLPALLFVVVRAPLPSIIGIVAAGALIGVLCAPFVGWHYRRLGIIRALGASLFTIAGSAWSSSMLIAILAVMAASD